MDIEYVIGEDEMKYWQSKFFNRIQTKGISLSLQSLKDIKYMVTILKYLRYLGKQKKTHG